MGPLALVLALVVVLPALFLATGAVVCAALGASFGDPAAEPVDEAGVP